MTNSNPAKRSAQSVLVGSLRWQRCWRRREKGERFVPTQQLAKRWCSLPHQSSIRQAVPNTTRAIGRFGMIERNSWWRLHWVHLHQSWCRYDSPSCAILASLRWMMLRSSESAAFNRVENGGQFRATIYMCTPGYHSKEAHCSLLVPSSIELTVRNSLPMPSVSPPS